MTTRFAVVTALLIGACHAGGANPGPQPQAAPSRYVFVWAGDADQKETDFLAVIDVDPKSPVYASVVATVPVAAVATKPHHTEHEMPAGGELWANGFQAGTTFRFDLRDPAHPRLAGSFGNIAGMSMPHSFVRLPNGNVLATFQHLADTTRMRTGGLVELDPTGKVVRYANASTAVDSGVRPYSLAILPDIDRIVVTATDMHGQVRSRAVQVWRLSNLTLLHTLLLPPGSRGDEQWLTAEPRVLADGRTVMVNTFSCGLYRLGGLDGDTPTAEYVYSSPWQAEARRLCAIPLTIGNYWIQTDGPAHAIVTLDISDPGHPREVSRLTLPAEETPHWIALEPNGDRIVLTGYQGIESRVMLLHLDRTTGALRVDSTFTTPGAGHPGVSLDREQWPHGASGRAIPHGAVFSRQ